MAAKTPKTDHLHIAAAHALVAAAPAGAQGKLADLLKRAQEAKLPWGKILAAIATAAAGGFTPAALAAAAAVLFGAGMKA